MGAVFYSEKIPESGGTFRHVGSIDVNLAVHPDIMKEGKYATIVEILTKRGYAPAKYPDGRIKEFSFIREVVSPVDGRPYSVGIDFLSTEYPGKKQPRHRRVQPDLRARTAYGIETVFTHCFDCEMAGTLPGNGQTAVNAKVTDIVGCLTTKALTAGRRYWEKDAYDISAVISHYKNGPENAAREFRKYLGEPLVREGFNNIKRIFSNPKSDGPAWVGKFLHPHDDGGQERAATDAFMKVNDFVKFVEGE